MFIWSCRCLLVVFMLCAFCLSMIGNLEAQDKKYALPKPKDGELAPRDPIFHEALKRGTEWVYADQFETALGALDSLIAEYPDHPGPHFYRAATLQTWMSSRRFNAFQDELESSVEKTIETGEKLLIQNADDPWLDFYMGGAYGYRAYFKFGRYNFLGAYQDGKKGIEHFRTCLKKEPRLYDVYLGLGSYYYWRSARSRVLRWLLFWMADKRALGLEQIALAMHHGQYSRYEAYLVLVTALYDSGQYDRAWAVLNNRSDTQQPANLYGFYLRGLLEVEQKEWGAVEAGFRYLDSRLEQSAYAAVGYRIECRYRIAVALAQMGRHSEALEMAQSAIALRVMRDPDKELESLLWPYDDIKKALDQLYKELNRP
jgi:hypothetical protein